MSFASPLNTKAQSSYDWLFANPPAADIHAPHPDQFESELDSADLSALTAFVFDYDTSDASLLFGGIRGLSSNNSVFPGPPSSITASSESLSAYNDYDAYSAYSARDSLPGTGYSTSPSTSLFSQNQLDVDINLSGFSITPSSPPLNMSPATSSWDLDAVAPRRYDTVAVPSSSPIKSSPMSYGLSPTLGLDSASMADSLYLSGAYGVSPNHLGVATPPITPPASHPSANRTQPSARVQDSDPRKKYPCPNCTRAFARAFNLKTHMATHDPHRVKSHVCKYPGCGRSFSRKHDLGRHLISIHQDRGNKVIGIGGGSSSKPRDRERVWCDSCGRGWLKGSKDAACACGHEIEINVP